VGQDSLNRFDNTFSKNKKRNKKKKPNGPRMEGEGVNTAPKPAQRPDRPQGNRPQQDKAQQNRPQQNRPQQPKPAAEGGEGNAPQAQANPNKKKNNRRRPPRKNTGGNEGTEK